MVETHGLSHISLSVRDPEASLAFYTRLFGVREYHREENAIQVLGPGPHDVLVFERRDGHGERGGVDHFGFRLKDPRDIERAEQEAREAGGTILRRGEFAPGEPYLYVADPDGYEIEIWFEPAAEAG